MNLNALSSSDAKTTKGLPNMRPSSLKQKIMSLKMDEGENCYSVKARQSKIKRYHGYKAGRYMLPNDEVILSLPTFQTHQCALINNSY